VNLNLEVTQALADVEVLVDYLRHGYEVRRTTDQARWFVPLSVMEAHIWGPKEGGTYPTQAEREQGRWTFLASVVANPWLGDQYRVEL
jgi:hypothetical protein